MPIGEGHIHKNVAKRPPLNHGRRIRFSLLATGLGLGGFGRLGRFRRLGRIRGFIRGRRRAGGGLAEYLLLITLDLGVHRVDKRLIVRRALDNGVSVHFLDKGLVSAPSAIREPCRSPLSVYRGKWSSRAA